MYITVSACMSKGVYIRWGTIWFLLAHNLLQQKNEREKVTQAFFRLPTGTAATLCNFPVFTKTGKFSMTLSQNGSSGEPVPFVELTFPVLMKTG